MEEQLKIILADDNKTFLVGLQFILNKNFNCEFIDICNNGNELVQSPFLSQSDLVITDISMPEINGVEAAKRINVKYSTLPMIAITMHLENIYLHEIVCAGFKGFVYKPDVSKNLTNVVHQVLRKQFVFPDNLKIDKYSGGVL